MSNRAHGKAGAADRLIGGAEVEIRIKGGLNIPGCKVSGKARNSAVRGVKIEKATFFPRARGGRKKKFLTILLPCRTQGIQQGESRTPKSPITSYTG